MLIATMASSKYQEMKEFLLHLFNIVPPPRHFQNHLVLLFHAHECKAQALMVANLRP